MTLNGNALVIDYSRTAFKNLLMIPEFLCKRFKKFKNINIVVPGGYIRTLYDE